MKTILSLLFLAVACQAQLVMDFQGGNDLSVGPGTAGFSFTLGEATTIRSLGLWDSDTTTPGLYSSHTIGLWDADTHLLLAQATVPAQGATAVGAFWYMPIAPVALQAGRAYVLGATYADSDFDFARGNVASVTTGFKGVMGDALLSNGTGFEFPSLNVSGANLGFFGPNMLSVAVPEPGDCALAVALLLVGYGIVRRV